MNDPSSNPIYIVFLFLLRCLVPIAILFGISYLLRKMGFVATEAPEPPDDRDDDEINNVKIPAAETSMKADTNKGEGEKITPSGKTGKTRKTGKTGPKAPGKSRGGKKPVAKPRSRSK